MLNRFSGAFKPAMLVTLIAGAATLLAQNAAFAQRQRDFHGRDLRRFSLDERRLWLSGGWIHEFHNGRYGWWWVVDGVWYFYPQPIYPYPTYVAEPEAVVNAPPQGAYPPPQGYGPPPQSGYGPPPPTGAPQAVTWYYCDNPQGYYPYVQNCGSGWRQVPSAPPGYQLPPPPQ
jgi:hypothetical protein